MGHYRSEMGYEERDACEAKEKKQRRDRMAKKIKRAIDTEGLSYVLADILDDPTLASIRFS